MLSIAANAINSFHTINKEDVMGFRDALAKFRQWDNKVAKWLMYNFYYTFFHLVIIISFFFWFFNLLMMLHVNFKNEASGTIEKILFLNAMNSSMIVFLLLLNSLWILYLLNNSHRIKNSLKNISYNTAPRPFNRDKRRNEPGNKNEPREPQG